MKKYFTKDIKIPEMVIGSEEKKPFTLWTLITKSRTEVRLNWNFWGWRK